MKYIGNMCNYYENNKSNSNSCINTKDWKFQYSKQVKQLPNFFGLITG